MTGVDGQSSPTIDPLASQRAELLGQVVAAQFDLERMIGELTRGGAGLAMAQDQLRALAQLRKQIGQAGPSALVTLRGDISIAVAQTQAIANQSRAAAASIEEAEIDTVASASAAAHATAQSFMHDFYDRKIFDRYLRFSSAEDEAEYRKREQAYRRAIDTALAKGTPEGDLEATRLMKGQLADAGAHGADRSPDFADRLRQADDRERTLSAAITAAPKKDAVANAAIATVPSEADMANALAALRAAGSAPPTPDEQRGHGLTKEAGADTIRARGRGN